MGDATMMILALLLVGQSDDAAIQAESWARKAKPIATCSSASDCEAKWSRGTAWIKRNSRFQVAVDRPDLFATYGAVYANTGLSFVLTKRAVGSGQYEIAARAWCGNVLTCKPKPKNALAALTREIG